MEQEEKAVIKIDAEGKMMNCAKGHGGDDCGYKTGAKMCGKCGAMAVEVKDDDADSEDLEAKSYDEIDEDDEIIEKALAAVATDEDEDEDEEESDEEESDEESDDDAEMKAVGNAPQMDEEEDEEDEDEEEDDVAPAEAAPAEEATPADDEPTPDSDAEMEEEEEDDEEEDDEEEKGWMGDARKRRLQTMGRKSADLGQTGFLCAVERKVYPGSASVCDDCPGGCIAEKGMPGLIEIEGKAEAEFNGTVIDSGYSQDSDIYVIDLEVKDGHAIEVFMEGSTGETLGFHRLDDSVFEQKSLTADTELIDFNVAAEIAVKSIEGVEGIVTAVEPDTFEGFDVYAVEVDGIDGKSYDVFVALDGEVLGFDTYEPDEAEEIEAEAAEIALKRAFNESQREEMAKEGLALPDGSFPISNVDDLRNAIMAHGRAVDKEKAKKHIIKRAREMGKEEMIPAAWTSAKKEDAEVNDINDASFMRSLVEFEMLMNEDDSNDGNS